jgi:hypothetical protein
LDLTIAVPADDHRAMRAEWEADLLQGAIAESIHAAGVGEVVGSRVSWRLPDGTVLENRSGGMGDIAPEQLFDEESDAQLVARVESRLAAAGLTPETVEIVRAGQPAPAIVVTSQQPRTDVSQAWSTINDIVGRPPRYEGYYFEIRDDQNATVFIQSAAFRTGAGRHYIATSYAGVDPITHGALATTSP